MKLNKTKKLIFLFAGIAGFILMLIGTGALKYVYEQVADIYYEVEINVENRTKPLYFNGEAANDEDIKDTILIVEKINDEIVEQQTSGDTSNILNIYQSLTNHEEEKGIYAQFTFLTIEYKKPEDHEESRANLKNVFEQHDQCVAEESEEPGNNDNLFYQCGDTMINVSLHEDSITVYSSTLNIKSLKELRKYEGVKDSSTQYKYSEMPEDDCSITEPNPYTSWWVKVDDVVYCDDSKLVE